MARGLQIGIVGAGPAGLYFALLMKRSDPAHRIRVLEQNPAGVTYGWGVVFSGRALSFLRESDAESYAAIEAEMQRWDDQTIVHRNEDVRIDGSTYSGIARLALLAALERRCRALGVEIAYGRRVEGPAELGGCDLVVGADGVHSVVRSRLAEFFEPEVRLLTNRYIWYGTRQRFETLSLIFREHRGGHYVAHCYSHAPRESTFIVECDAATWQRAGFAAMDERESRAYCEEIFAADLEGHPLLSNRSAWLSYKVVTNRRWSRGNVVLLGDALRTVHFSIGSGTRMALEDAIALHRAFQESADAGAALRRFEEIHRPSVEKFLEIARRSYDWYERFPEKMERMDAVELAYDYVIRSGRIDFAALKERSPRFAAAWEARRARGLGT